MEGRLEETLHRVIEAAEFVMEQEGLTPLGLAATILGGTAFLLALPWMMDAIAFWLCA